MIWKYEQDLPDYTQLKNYEPPVMTRVHAGDGSLLAEYARERRLYLPSRRHPAAGQGGLHLGRGQEFLHPQRRRSRGHRAAPSRCWSQGNKRAQGASTITQQVAKNFLLTNERSFDRKIREALLAFRIESAYSKEKILELYLNEIYLGLGNYGVAAAALNYFDKSVHELSGRRGRLSRGAAEGPEQLPALPASTTAPIERRNWVIDRMVENGYVIRSRRREGQGRAARRQPARAVAQHLSRPAISPRRSGAS